MLTIQEAFNKAVIGVVTQGGPSIARKQRKGFNYDTSEIIECLYRGPNDRKCAVGHLIEDSEYSPMFEGVSVDGFKEIGVTKAAGLEAPKVIEDLKEHLYTLSSLQRAHDKMETDEDLPLFIKRARDIAKDAELTFPEKEVQGILANTQAKEAA